MAEKRSSFSGKLGFILAAAGSAVGLGNIWRFPYLAAEYGGGIFLLTYIVLAFTLGFALLCTEIAIGRKTGKSVIDAYKSLDKRFSFVGWMGAIVPVIILPYYSVIGGWVVKYFTHYIIGKGSDTAKTIVVDGVKNSFFDLFITEPYEPLIWFLVFLGLTAVIVLLGVEKGIEKVSKVMMPLLVLLTLGIAIYVLCMDGAIEGLVYYVKPDFAKFSFKTVLAAMGQLFYSMSIAMGIMVTYGSYMKKDINLASSARSIAVFDFGIAFLAGLMVIPAVFAGGDSTQLNKGAGLMFATLPKVFEKMPGGHVVGTLFFLLVFFAAITSSISLMETIVSVFMDKKGWSRRKASIVVLIISIVLGGLSALGYGTLSFISIKSIGFYFLEMFDFITNSVIMPIVAFLTCLFVGYVLKPKTIIKEMNIGSEFKGEKFYVVMVKYIAPICILAILVFSVLEGLGIMKV